MKKIKLKELAMKTLSCSAMLCAVVVVNITCPFFFHQEKEPASVRKLRKF